MTILNPEQQAIMTKLKGIEDQVNEMTRTGTINTDVLDQARDLRNQIETSISNSITTDSTDFGFTPEPVSTATPDLTGEDFGFVPEEDFGFQPEVAPAHRGAIESFVAGLGGQETPSEFPGIGRYVKENIPASLGRLVGGFPEFLQQVGKTVVANPLATTGKAVGIIPMQPNETIKGNLYKDISEVGKLFEGIGRFAATPLGLNFSPETKISDVNSMEKLKRAYIENLKKAYIGHPIESILGALLIKHGIGRSETAKPLGEATKPATIGGSIEDLITRAPENIVPEEAPKVAAKVFPSTLDIVEQNVGLRNNPVVQSPVDFLNLNDVIAEMQKEQKIKDAQATIQGVENLKEAEVGTKASESAQVLDSLEAKLIELRSSAAKIRELSVGSREGALQIAPVEETPTKGASILEAARKLNELKELKKVAEIATGMNLDSIYGPAIKDIVNSIPDESRILVLRDAVDTSIQEAKGVYTKPRLKEYQPEKLPSKARDARRAAIRKTIEDERAKKSEAVATGKDISEETVMERARELRKKDFLTQRQIASEVKELNDKLKTGEVSEVEALTRVRFLQNFSNKDLELNIPKKSLSEAIKNREESSTTLPQILDTSITRVSKESSEISKIKNIIDTEDINTKDIPKDMEIDVEAIREKTGSIIKVKDNARSVIDSLNNKIAKYKNLIECL